MVLQRRLRQSSQTEKRKSRRVWLHKSRGREHVRHGWEIHKVSTGFGNMEVIGDLKERGFCFGNWEEASLEGLRRGCRGRLGEARKRRQSV